MVASFCCCCCREELKNYIKKLDAKTMIVQLFGLVRCSHLEFFKCTSLFRLNCTATSISFEWIQTRFMILLLEAFSNFIAIHTTTATPKPTICQSIWASLFKHTHFSMMKSIAQTNCWCNKTKKNDKSENKSLGENPNQKKLSPTFGGDNVTALCTVQSKACHWF